MTETKTRILKSSLRYLYKEQDSRGAKGLAILIVIQLLCSFGGKNDVPFVALEKFLLHMGYVRNLDCQELAPPKHFCLLSLKPPNVIWWHFDLQHHRRPGIMNTRTFFQLVQLNYGCKGSLFLLDASVLQHPNLLSLWASSKTHIADTIGKIISGKANFQSWPLKSSGVMSLF